VKNLKKKDYSEIECIFKEICLCPGDGCNCQSLVDFCQPIKPKKEIDRFVFNRRAKMAGIDDVSIWKIHQRIFPMEASASS